MNLRRIDLNLLTIFDAIIAEGSITKAAARLGMTQPALSNALTRLRRQVDDPLFVRVGNRIVPTPRAEALAVPIRQALELAERALSGHPDEPERDEERTFTLALGDIGETISLPRAMARLRREAGRAPRFRIKRAVPGTIASDLGSGALDLAWLVLPVRLREVSVEPVMSDELVCLIAPEQANEPLTPDRYFAFDHVAIATEAEAPGFGHWRRQRRIAVEAHGCAPVAALVATAGLAATLPKRIANHYAALHGLAVLPLPFETPSIIVYQAWPRTLDQDRTHARLRRALKAAAR